MSYKFYKANIMNPISKAEENHLKAIFNLCEEFGKPASTNAIAKIMKWAAFIATGNTYRPSVVLKKYRANIVPSKTIGLKIAIHFGNAVLPVNISLIHRIETTNIAKRSTLTKGSLCSENVVKRGFRSCPAAIL